MRRRLHEHGHQVGRQPLHQRPQLLLHERLAAGRQRRRRPAAAPGSGAGRADRRRRQSDRHLATTGARRWAARSCGTSCGSSARSAGGGSTSSRSARSTPTARRASTTTASANDMGKVTWQATPNTRVVVPVQPHLKDRFHRRDAPYLFVEDKADDLQIRRHDQLRGAGQPGGRQATVRRRPLRPDVGQFPSRCTSRRCSPPTSRSATRCASPASTPPKTSRLNPNHRYQANGNLTLLRCSGAGAHTLKAGVQLSWERMAYDASATATSCSRCATACRSRRRSPTRRSTPTTG